VTAVKQAIEIREFLPESKVFCFYMDMRMGGALYEELYREAQEKWGVSFIRGKVSEASETIDNKLLIKVEDTLAGRPLKMKLDLLVLDGRYGDVRRREKNSRYWWPQNR
jgi:heterodisulfide reductase subunit A